MKKNILLSFLIFWICNCSVGYTQHYNTSTFESYNTNKFYYNTIVESTIVKKKIQEFYNINGDLQFEPIFHGVANMVFLVKHNNKIICALKYYPRKELKEVKLIVEITENLREKLFPIPKVDFILKTPDKHVISAMQYCAGEHRYFHSQKRRNVAALMAKIHLMKVPGNIPTRLIDISKFNFLFEQCKNWKHIKQIKEIYDQIDKSYFNKLPRGLIHGDFSFSNILFGANHEISGILDFDHVSNSYLLTDLARAQIFYGFEKDGKLNERKITEFVKEYNSHRCLAGEELVNFYNHVKLMLIYVALDVYYHAYVLQDLDHTRFSYSKSNNDVNPEMLFRKLLHVQNKSYIDISDNKIYSKLNLYQNPPVFFLGESGVGKSTLIKKICALSDIYYIPKFTVTRTPREDDDPKHFEYITELEYLRLRKQGKLIVDMSDRKTFYGYRANSLNQTKKIPLMNASASGLKNAKLLPGLYILVEGDSNFGLDLRGDTTLAKSRKEHNKIVSKEYFKRADFRKDINIIFFNSFKDPDRLAQDLENKIEKEVLKRRNTLSYEMAINLGE